MKKTLILTLVLILFAGIEQLDACSSVIISGKVTKDGRPVMWKHRDTSAENNKLLYFTEGKYHFIGMVSTGRSERKSVWMGMNSAGFCIMNTLSYNINPEDDENNRYGEGAIMARALAECATLEDFEKLLESLVRPTGLSANYGVIDAWGGAAYYEVGNHEWHKIDVNDRSVAPLGYVVRTNYSFMGDPDRGQGHARYITASDIFYRMAMENDLTAESILRKADRSLVNGFTGDNLIDLSTGSNSVRMVHFRDNIARKSTTSTAIFHGVRKGEDPLGTVMWAVTGWPLATVAYPVWMNDDHILPSLLTAPDGKNAAICDAGLRAKNVAMPLIKGHGQDYININKVYNTDNTGYMQWIRPLEDEIIRLTHEHILTWKSASPSASELRDLYGEIDEIIIGEYAKHDFRLN